MPEVQNVGAADYAQYQPSQYPAENYAEDYSMQPEVYDEHAEQMKVASKSRMGATLLSTAVIAGLALWGGHAWGKKSAKDAVQKYENIKTAMEDLNKDADKVIDTNFGGFQYGKDLAKKVKNLFNKLFPNAEEGAEKAADEVKEAAEELKEKATDAMK